MQGAPSGGADPSHPKARHGIWKAERSAQGAAVWGQGLPGDKALRGGPKERERSRDRPDLEGQAPPHSCTCTEGTKELRSCPPPRTDIAFLRTAVCNSCALREGVLAASGWPPIPLTQASRPWRRAQLEKRPHSSPPALEREDEASPVLPGPGGAGPATVGTWPRRRQRPCHGQAKV